MKQKIKPKKSQYNRKVIMDKAEALADQQEILAIYRIPFDRSEDLTEVKI